MNTANSRRIEALLLLAALLAAPVAQAAPAASEDAGRRIYREGVLPSGEPLRARLGNGATLSGAAAACVVCHRRSGLGGGEGQNAVRPIAGRLLFEPAHPRGGPPAGSLFSPVETRPVYTRATLVRALREGVDPSGRKFDGLMPRFELGDREIAQLSAYLERLMPDAATGVTDDAIHFATAIAPDATPAQEEAMLAVLRAFIADKNGGTRQERRRRDIGRSVIGSEQMYRGYRHWQLHVWRLRGAPETWSAQLEREYRRQPVFALLSGVGNGDWLPVHEFCERNETPCLFPNANPPQRAGEDYSSFYFSRGPALEAGVLARHLSDAGLADSGQTVVQVYRDDAGGQASAQALRAALQRLGIDSVVDRPLGGEAKTEADWIRLLDADRPETLVLWLDDADLAEFPLRHEAPPWLSELYLSGSLVAQTGRFMQAEDWRDRVAIVYPFELQERIAPRMARLRAWLRARNVPQAEERIQANAFFAATIAGDALAHMDENYSQDYFIERVEHMTEQSLFPSVYPRLSLGPGQRFASRGGYVVGFAQDGTGRTTPLSDWIVP